LKVALVVFRLNVFLTGGTSDFATMMVMKTGTSNNTFAFLAFHQSTTQGFGRTGIIFMAVAAFVTFKEAVTVFAKFPFNDRTVLGMTQLAQIATRMAGNFVVALLTFMAILFTGKEGRHTSDDVVMVVMMVHV
jgi:FAD/FMN-containing dehydrogenase